MTHGHFCRMGFLLYIPLFVLSSYTLSLRMDTFTPVNYMDVLSNSYFDPTKTNIHLGVSTASWGREDQGIIKHYVNNLSVIQGLIREA